MRSRGTLWVRKPYKIRVPRRFLARAGMSILKGGGPRKIEVSRRFFTVGKEERCP